MNPAIVLLSAITAERLAELYWARRNTAALLARGAAEYAPQHYSAIVLLHALWLAGLWIFGWNQALSLGWCGVFVALQFLRLWTLWTLGRRWTTRIIVLPGAPLKETGPYRFLAHPNYLVVIGEIAVLPLCFGLPWLSLIFSIANAGLLSLRIRAENAALIGSANVGRR
jgi:methyltransferase